ncbi:MAG: hypothetical protein ACOC1O_00750 [bacterium]
MQKLNEEEIKKRWSPMIESKTGIKESEKLDWVSKYAHYHALNEAADGMGGVTTPYATLYNVPGVGNAQPANQAATTAGQWYGGDSQGSGDKWPALLPMALQVAARTIGFDIVNVVPMPGPTGVVSYLDYVYAGGKQPYGAKPARDEDTANPDEFRGNSAYDYYDAPHAFKIALDSSAKMWLEEGDTVTFASDSDISTNTLSAQYIGKSRIDGYSLFKIESFGTEGDNLADVFADGDAFVEVDSSIADVNAYPQMISTLEDHVQGFAGAGASDNDDWDGTFVDGTQMYEPMERGVGEMQYPKALGLQVFTKFVQVGTYQVSVSVTQEQIQDLNKQWGVDVIAMVENAGINEISQSINKHILSRAFALGWKNHIKANEAENINLNLRLDSSSNGTSPSFAYPTDTGVVNESMTTNGYHDYGIGSAGGFENQDTYIKRIMANVLGAGNVVMQRGRRGPANFIVTNVKIATAMQSNSQYSFSPISNTFNQNNGSLYPLGTIAGMTLYVDPNMKFNDTRVLVGRKGASDEPGIVFCPYLMAESVKLITEGTGAPKVIIKSRYALVDAGWHPETQYMTLYFKTNEGQLA